MIKFAKDMPVTQRENVMGGTGRYSSQMLFSPEEVTKTRLFACNTMEPGASIGCHSHTGEGEAYLILSGVTGRGGGRRGLYAPPWRLRVLHRWPFPRDL